jgi:transcription initiation factor TFIIIB Brf1 subunit/transcription initiation factor TFIIB
VFANRTTFIRYNRYSFLYIGGEGKILERKVPSFLCEEGVHQEVYDRYIGEAVCKSCGLVLNDELRYEFTLVLSTPPRTRKPCKRRRPKSRPSGEQRVETFLNILLEEGRISTSVQEKTLELYKLLRKQGGLRGRSTVIAAKALLYIAGRLHQVPLTLSILAEDLVESKKVMRLSRKICKELKLETPRLECGLYLAHLAHLLVKKKKIDRSIEKDAAPLLKRVKEKHLLRGTHPMGIAAAVLYMSSKQIGLKLTQKEIAEIARISEVTIRTNCKGIRRVMDEL